MKNDERLSGALQENILTLLVFDDVNAKMVRAALTPQLFESSVFREIAGHAIDFIDQFGETIKDHLPDHLEGILNGDDARKASTYKRLVDNLFTARDSVNGDYVISQLHKFVRQQKLKDAVIKAVEAIEDGRIDQAESELLKGLNSQSVAFSGGLNLSSAEDVLSVLDQPEAEGFHLGIKELDDNGVIPRRKELFCLLAPRGKGKSWFLTHCAKQALLQRWSVVIITLEMSEPSYAARMLQSFFSISRREAKIQVTRLITNKEGDLQDLIQERVDRMSMKDPDIRGVLSKRAKREFGRRPPFRIKQFPTGALDLAGLEAYLDGLERFEKFTPDVILLDYPKLMKMNPLNLRVELGAITEGLRGVAVKRNASVVIVAQGNRESENATLVTGNQVSEDISMLATVDNMLTYSQTSAEHKLGLARLFVEKARNEEAKFQTLITQAYGIGQFCLDSIPLRGDYWEFMEDRGERDQARDKRRRGRNEEQD
jgi:replicative DNA helicase